MFTLTLPAHPILFQYGSFILYSHALFFIAGAECAGLLACSLAKRDNLTSEKVWTTVLGIFIAGLVMARLGYAVIYPHTFHSLGEVLAIWRGGLVSYVGLVGAIIWFWISQRSVEGVERKKWLDIYALVGVLGWAIGRIGNYLAADSVGVPSFFWRITYTRVPIQLFESLLCLGIFVAGYLVWRQRRLIPGLLAICMGLVYFGVRFFIDIWRDEASYFGLHLSQLTDLAFFLLVFILLYRQRHFYAQD